MRRFQPALLGGLFIGVLSSLPVVSAGNVCCCLWVVVGGFLTVYLQRQSPEIAKDTTEAVLGGLIAGAIGGVISVVATGLLASLGGTAMVAQIESAFDQIGSVPADVRDRVIALAASGAWVLVIAAVTLPVYAIFGMLGALLAVALLPKPKSPTPDPPAPLAT